MKKTLNFWEISAISVLGLAIPFALLSYIVFSRECDEEFRFHLFRLIKHCFNASAFSTASLFFLYGLIKHWDYLKKNK